MVAKDPTGMIDDFLFDPRMALQKIAQVVVLIEISFAIDQFGIAAQLACHPGMILQKSMKLADFNAQPILVAARRGCGGA